MVADTSGQPDLVVRLTGRIGEDELMSPRVGVVRGNVTGRFKTDRVVPGSVNATERDVLEALDAGGASGPEIADELGVSRTAVWKAIESLRTAGFKIDAGEDGYVLREIAEYGAAAVEHRLDPEFAVEHHDAISSTNARARERARSGEFGRASASGVVVLADEQTGGRGRLDRKWVSPPGGVWMSVLLRPDLPPARTPLLTLAAAVATARALDGVVSDTGGSSIGLKWPNDVLVVDDGGTERKLAGILTEMEGETDEVSWLVVGIGLNANVDGADLPEGATSLRELVGDVDRGRFVADLLGEFDALRATADEILPAWRRRTLTLYRRVRVETGGRTLVGTATGIESPGVLLVDSESDIVRIHAGDCEHLRAVGE
jgi:BirA family biotin operon repressor/biotin-[acetyl-CoA-carboxylase] ligase